MDQDDPIDVFDEEETPRHYRKKYKPSSSTLGAMPAQAISFAQAAQAKRVRLSHARSLTSTPASSTPTIRRKTGLMQDDDYSDDLPSALKIATRSTFLFNKKASPKKVRSSGKARLQHALAQKAVENKQKQQHEKRRYTTGGSSRLAIADDEEDDTDDVHEEPQYRSSKLYGSTQVSASMSRTKKYRRKPHEFEKLIKTSPSSSASKRGYPDRPTRTPVAAKPFRTAIISSESDDDMDDFEADHSHTTSTSSSSNKYTTARTTPLYADYKNPNRSTSSRRSSRHSRRHTDDTARLLAGMKASIAVTSSTSSSARATRYSQRTRENTAKVITEGQTADEAISLLDSSEEEEEEEEEEVRHAAVDEPLASDDFDVEDLPDKVQFDLIEAIQISDTRFETAQWEFQLVIAGGNTMHITMTSTENNQKHAFGMSDEEALSDDDGEQLDLFSSKKKHVLHIQAAQVSHVYLNPRIPCKECIFFAIKLRETPEGVQGILQAEQLNMSQVEPEDLTQSPGDDATQEEETPETKIMVYFRTEHLTRLLKAGLSKALNGFASGTESKRMEMILPNKGLEGLLKELNPEYYYALATTRVLADTDVYAKYPLTSDSKAKNPCVVRKVDLERLNPGEFLNDRLVNLYLAYIESKMQQFHRRDFMFFNSFFYTRMRTLKGKDRFKAVSSWTKGIDVFSKRFIVIPVCEHLHWSVAVLCYPGGANKTGEPSQENNDSSSVDMTQEEEAKEEDGGNFMWRTINKVKNFTRALSGSQGGGSQSGGSQGKQSRHFSSSGSHTSDVEAPFILWFDSLFTSRTKSHIFRILEGWLDYEWNEHHNRTFREFRNIPIIDVQTTKQDNSSDCGAYLLHYIETFSNNPPRSPKLVREYKDKQARGKFKAKRQVIHRLLEKLHKEMPPRSPKSTKSKARSSK